MPVPLQVVCSKCVLRGSVVDAASGEHCGVCATVSTIRARRQYVSDEDMLENMQARLEKIGLSRYHCHTHFCEQGRQQYKYAVPEEVPIRFFNPLTGELIAEDHAPGDIYAHTLLVRAQYHLKNASGSFVPSNRIVLRAKGSAWDNEAWGDSNSFVARGLVEFDLYVKSLDNDDGGGCSHYQRWLATLKGWSLRKPKCVGN